MPRTPKPTDGATAPAKPRRPSTKKPNGNGKLVTDQVAQRAYEIFESRGRQHGADLDDWLEAERELKRRSPASAAKS